MKTCIYIYVVEREKSCVLKDDHSVQGRECFFLKFNKIVFLPFTVFLIFIFLYLHILLSPLFHPRLSKIVYNNKYKRISTIS